MVELKPIIILEGYLALYDINIRDLLDVKIYLDIPIEESVKRRSSNKFTLDQKYFENVLLPMHKQFVEPTKNYVDIIDVSNLKKEEIIEQVLSKINFSNTHTHREENQDE
jgi:uridine kinase